MNVAIYYKDNIQGKGATAMNETLSDGPIIVIGGPPTRACNSLRRQFSRWQCVQTLMPRDLGLRRVQIDFGFVGHSLQQHGLAGICSISVKAYALNS